MSLIREAWKSNNIRLKTDDVKTLLRTMRLKIWARVFWTTLDNVFCWWYLFYCRKYPWNAKEINFNRIFQGLTNLAWCQKKELLTDWKLWSENEMFWSLGLQFIHNSVASSLYIYIPASVRDKSIQNIYGFGDKKLASSIR